jgi:hypothetical protein
MSDEREPGKYELAPELVTVQNELAHLSPKALRIDRDQLMFNAGRAAERATLNLASGAVPSPVPVKSFNAHFWPAAAATMTAATILLSAMLAHERRPQSIANETKPRAASTADSQLAASEFSVASRTSFSGATSGYLGMRNMALSRGVGALASEFSTDTDVLPLKSKPVTARELRDELLPGSRQRG